MGAVLGTLGNLGYGFAYRVLDAQYFGLAQRRKRVFIVGCLGEPWSRAGEVLLERDGFPWNPPPRRAPGKDASRGTEEGPGGNLLVGPRGLDPQEGHLVAVGVQDPPLQVPTHEVSPCLQERGGKGPDSDMTQAYVMSYRKSARTRGGDTPETWVDDGLANTLNVWENTDIRTTHAIVETTHVRRLTPLECERLQGFPDNWTAPEADSPRYQMMGNAVAVPVAAWIAERIRKIEENA